ncbi:MAG: TerB family tellurite resistance protein [Bdellovibrionales bacterium]|nr:TerB family tellurite resistance protein [Bdellovibrionales bacterium]
MSSEGSHVLNQTIQSIFQNHKNSLQGQSAQSLKKRGLDPKELELAVTVLLVDLASADQEFDPSEYHVIQNGLMRLFGTGKHEVTQLIHQAKSTLANLRGVSRFGELLNRNLDHEQKIAVMEVIEEVIQADGQEDGYETYLRHKFAGMLGIKLTELNGATE